LGAVDTAIALAENADRERILTVEKQKDSPEGESMRFKLEPVLEYDSAVLELVSRGGDKPKLSANVKRALEVLAAGPTNHTTWLSDSTLSKATFDRARLQLVKAGLVSKGGDAQYRLTLTGSTLLAA
jgi:hypothetical protein